MKETIISYCKKRLNLFLLINFFSMQDQLMRNNEAIAVMIVVIVAPAVVIVVVKMIKFRKLDRNFNKDFKLIS